MISGNKKDIAKVLPYVNERLRTALRYIETTDFSALSNGEYEIDGRNVFVRVNTYVTEPREQKKPESHNAYIDVQFLGSGSETIWYMPKDAKHIVSVDRSAEDLLFYAAAEEKDCVNLTAGDFAIFFPWELHRPGCSQRQPEKVQKIVVKVLAE